MIIYKIQNKITNKIYIGQTVRALKERMKEHCSHSKTAIDKALNKYEKKNFKCKVIDTAKTIEELNNKEKFWIAYYNCCVPNGYNLCTGGENTMGYKHTRLTKIKMSKAQFARNMKGENNPFYGKTHTKESKLKMSKARKGRTLTEEWKRNISKGSTTKRKVINLDTEEIFETVTKASEKYSIPATHISRVCRKKRKRTGGYRWMYYDEYMTIPCQTKKETF